MRAAIQQWNPNRAALGGRAHASLTQIQPIDRSEPHGVLATPALAGRARTLRASLTLGEIECRKERKREREKGRKRLEEKKEGEKKERKKKVNAAEAKGRAMTFALLFHWDPVRRASAREHERARASRAPITSNTPV